MTFSWEKTPKQLTWYYVRPMLAAEAGRLKYDQREYPIHGVSGNAITCVWKGLLADAPGGPILTDLGRRLLAEWKASPEGQTWLTRRRAEETEDEAEPLLTDADICAAVRLALGNWQGDALLAGGDLGAQVRAGNWGSAGWPTDHYSVNVTADRRGLLIRASEHPEGRDAAMRPGPPPPPASVRIGRIAWRQAEDILRAAQPDDGALFNLGAT